MRRIPDYSLWLGNAVDARDRFQLFHHEIAAVIDLAMEESPATTGHEMIYGRFPLVDGTENPKWMLRGAIDLTASLLQAKVPTLVACGGGVSRSPVIAAAALVKLGRPSLEEALTFLANFGRCDVSMGLLNDIRTL
jgi:protein-tyrosine phosphatase